MSTVSKGNPKKAAHEWILQKKELAQQQLSALDGIMNRLFLEEDFTKFLRLLSRMPYFSYHNLLIIYNQYPEAKCLASFATWQKIMKENGEPVDAKILRPEAVKGGMNIIAPFTNESKNGDAELTWYSVLMFDIQQTFVKYYEPRASVFIYDNMHLSFLLDAVTEVLVSDFGRRVIYEPNNQEIISSGLPGIISENTVSVRKDLEDEETLSWLTEALCILSVGNDTQISSQARNLLYQCICFTIYEIWGLEHSGVLPGIGSIIKESEQASFLDILQQTVFDIYQKTAGYYQEQRNEDSTLQDDFGFVFTGE